MEIESVRMEPNNNFEEILTKTIDESIRSIIGENGASAIYYHMQEYGIQSQKLGENPETLEKAMAEIFKVGWGVFEKAILNSLCQQLNLPAEKFVDNSFTEFVNIARREFSSAGAGSATGLDSGLKIAPENVEFYDSKSNTP